MHKSLLLIILKYSNTIFQNVINGILKIYGIEDGILLIYFKTAPTQQKNILENSDSRKSVDK